MKKQFTLCLMACVFVLQSYAQLSGSRQVPSDHYPDLQSIADSLNLHGIGQGV